jgi:CubicO group peptidase (beta-lactamase class C family)
LGWCQNKIDSLYDYLKARNTKGFMVLKDGKIVLEKYFGTFTQDSLNRWASAGKSLTATLVGMAQEKKLININNPVTQYLGKGWSSCTPAQENAITLLNLLTMTSGLNPNPKEPCDNTNPAVSCLTYLTLPNTQWAYHTGAYKQLEDVMSKAAGMTYNQYTKQQIGTRIGMGGAWFSDVYFGKVRDAARFGLLSLNRGVWAKDTLLRDTAYFRAMTKPSQNLNRSYGYLWWLNGQESYMAPGISKVFPGTLLTNAPKDMIAALGKDDQKIYVVPSQKLVVVRLGNSAYGQAAAFSPFDNELWTKISNLTCDVKYTLNVINGQGSGTYAAGDTVHIFATANASNQVFDRWLSSAAGLVALPTLREYHTRIVMPAQNTTLTATYAAAIPWTFTETTIVNKKVYYYFPAKMKGLILAFHGASGSAAGWVKGVENDNFHRYAVARGYGILVTESNDRVQKRWAVSPVSANNGDIVSINQILADLKTTGKLTGNEKLFAVGHSLGSGFASVIAFVNKFSASSQYGVNGSDPVFAVSTVPAIWNASRADTSADNKRLNQFYNSYNTYVARGIRAELHILEPSPLFSERFLRIPNITPTQAQGIFNDLKTANYLNDKNYFKVNPRLNESYINSVVSVPNSFDGDIDDQVTVAFTEHKFYSDHNFLTIDFFDRQLGVTTRVDDLILIPKPRVFPNPFVNKILVQSDEPSLEFTLVDQLGRPIYQGKNIGQQDFSALPAGVYFLEMKSGKGERLGVEKLVKW